MAEQERSKNEADTEVDEMEGLVINGNLWKWIYNIKKSNWELSKNSEK